MNLARYFSYTVGLERELDRTFGEKELLEAEVNGLRSATATAEALAEARAEELNRAYAEIKDLRAQNLALLDRFILSHRSVPVSERLTPTTAGPNEDKAKEYIDMSRRRTGPVAAARQNAEDKFAEERSQDLVQRAQLTGGKAQAAAASAAANIGPDEDLSELLHAD